jgi:HK97 family phage prohead protease
MKPRVPARPLIARSVPLIDLQVNSAGDGRTVTAYAATFDEPYAVRDEHGDYDEVIVRTAFNRALSHGIDRVGVLFNHGLTLYGTPSEEFSKPLGSPVEVRAEKRGLLTVTRYNRNPLADEVLEMIRNGDVKAQSFRGAIVQTAPPSIRNGRQLVRRLELGLKEYGPAPFPTNVAAGILAVRSTIADRLSATFTPEQVAEILEALGRDEIDLDSLAADLGTAPAALADTTAPEGATNHTPEQPAVEAPADPGSSVEILEAEIAALRARHNQ